MISDENASRIALEHFVAKFPKWPRTCGLKVALQGDRVVVSFFPENNAGLVNFFTRYKIEVDAETGEVLSMR